MWGFRTAQYPQGFNGGGAPKAPATVGGGLVALVKWAGWLGGLVFLLGKCGLVLRNPLPLCSWRLPNQWYVAWTDTQASHHVMLLYLNHGEEYRLESPSLPYARFFSFQSYSLWGDTSHGLLRDVDIVSHGGPNVFRNLTAAERGEKQGGFVLHLTADGASGRGHANELRVLGPGQHSGFFVLLFRLYDVGDVPHPKAPWAHLERGSAEQPERWGWTPPPRVLVRRVGKARHRAGPWREIPLCKQRLDLYASLLHVLDNLHDRLPSFHAYEGFVKPLRKNNFFHLQRRKLFTTPDSRSLGSAADIPIVEAALPEGDLWARVQATLPRTPRSLYAAPFVANQSAYDVRYVSFTSASRALPLRSYETLTDKSIRQHYQAHAHPSAKEWDGKFTLWIGPRGAPVPGQAKEENALVMAWGEKLLQAGGGPIDFPALLYRQLLAQTQTSPDLPPYHSALANVVVDKCPIVHKRNAYGEDDEEEEEEEEKEDEEEDEQEAAAHAPRQAPETVCCLSKAEAMPNYCNMPEFLHLRMRQFYPRVDYFVHEGDKSGPAHLRKLAV